MPLTYVVDASVVLSILLPDEKVTNQNIRYFRLLGVGKIIFIAPEILKYEVANSLKYSFNRRRISLVKTERLYKDFLEINIQYLPVNFSDVLKLSVDNNNLSFYDASYLYLAKANKCKLLTLDKALCKMIQ